LVVEDPEAGRIDVVEGVHGNKGVRHSHPETKALRKALNVVNEQRTALSSERWKGPKRTWKKGLGKVCPSFAVGPIDGAVRQPKGCSCSKGPIFSPNSNTMALRALIVDDEADARDNLRLMLEEYCPEVEIVGQAASAAEARELITSLQPNALFLDIKMPGEDGFQLLASISELDLPVVFTTAYDEYALKAFKQNALDYLEKPIDVDDLKRAVGKLQRLAGELGTTQPSAIAALLKDPASPLSSRLAIPGREGLVLLKHEDILYLEANDSYTTIHMKDGKRSVSSKHIRVFENNLDPKSFFRVHKSYIINLAHLSSFNRTEGNMAVLDTGAMIPVSRRRLPDFLGLINTF
jgi:two-component system, LytTR family, response regulator